MNVEWSENLPVNFPFGHHPKGHGLQVVSSNIISFSAHGVHTQQQCTPPRCIYNENGPALTHLQHPIFHNPFSPKSPFAMMME